GKKTIPDKKELAKLRGLYEYCWVLKPPKQPSIHVPYNILTFLVKIAPKGKEIEFITEKLQSYGYLQKGQQPDQNLRRRIEYALNWVKDFEEIRETAITLKTEEKNAIKELIETLKTEEDAEKIQNAIFNTAKKHDIPPPELFKTLYNILIGAPQGPRLGPYITAMGKQNVINALQRALSQSPK
ncbi:MAG: lysine--tRNA ligase, partial [Candidatus Bathyarchaeia archaeon]